MKVLLLQDVSKVGRKGEIKEVADGFGRNFLIARGFARAATEGALRSAAYDAENREKMQQAQAAGLKQLAEKLRGYDLKIAVKAGEKGQAFGSVSAADVAEALSKKGFSVETEWVALDEPIKKTGFFDVALRFPHGVDTKIKVIIEPEGAKKEEPKKAKKK